MAGVELGTGYVSIQPSFKGVQRSIDSELGGPLKASAAKAGDEAGRSFSDRFAASTGQSLDQFGKKSLAVAAVATFGLVKMADAAGNLEAAIAATDQVMGDASATVKDFAENAVESVGLSERAALEAATSFGQLGKIVGLTGEPLADFSIEMVQIAADMAAFKDVPIEQALQDLQSGFAGSTEVLRKYGIFLTDANIKQGVQAETGEEVSGVLDSQQRILGSYNQILAQTTDIQGQAARESEGLARAGDNAKASFENASASIGEALAPALASILNGAADAATGIATLNDATGGAAGVIAAFGTATLGVAGGTALIVDRAGKAVTAFKNMSRAAQLSSGALGAVGLALTVGYTIWSTYQQQQEDARARIKEASEALSEQTRLAFENADGAGAAADEVGNLTAANRALSNALIGSGDEAKEFTEALGAFGLTGDDALDVLLDIEQNGPEAFRRLAESANLTGAEVGELTKLFSGTAAAGEDVIVSTSGWSDELNHVADALNVLKSRQVDHEGQLDDITRSYLTAAVASGELSEEVVAEAEARAEASRNSEDARDVYEAVYEILGDMSQAERDAALGADELGEATASAVAPTKELNSVAASTIDVITDQERVLSDAADEADAFSSALGRLVGSQIDVQQASDDQKAAYGALYEQIVETNEGVDDATTSLDENTEAGRENRELIRSAAESTLSLGESMIEAGSSTDEAAAAMRDQAGDLRALLIGFGLTEAEADDYIRTLGLTPENIDTAVDLVNDERAKADIGKVIDRLDEIPEQEATLIQALIDEGKYAEAQSRLDFLDNPRTVSIRAQYTGVGNSIIGGTQSAYGNVFDSPNFTSVAEDGDREAVITLEKPANLRRQLSDDRIRGPILDALGGAGGWNVTVNNNGRRDMTSDDIARGIESARFRQ